MAFFKFNVFLTYYLSVAEASSGALKMIVGGPFDEVKGNQVRSDVSQTVALGNTLDRLRIKNVPILF